MRIHAWARIARKACLAAACAGLSAVHAGTLTGTATFRESVALPPGSTFEAVREDVSRAGAPPATIRVKDPPTKAGPPLRNTYWKLVALNGKPARTFKDQREPHIVLAADELRVSGSSGCNNLMGGFDLTGDKLTFSQMAGTMMMCPEGMEQENAFLKMLGKVARYRIGGDALTFFDEKGKAVAKFRAAAPR